MCADHLAELFGFLEVATETNSLPWRPFGNAGTFMAARNKFTISVNKSFLWLRDSGGDEVLRVSAEEDSRVAQIYNSARCWALEELESVIYDFMADN